MTVSPAFAAQIPEMGAKESNQKLALAISALSVALVFKGLSHCCQEQLREHDRRYEKRHTSHGGRGR